MEGSQLQARLEEEAVPGLLPGVKADPLVGGIGAGEAKDRVRISPLREAGQQSRRVEALPELPGTVPAEEPVLGVLPGQVEGELALQGGDAPAPSPADRRGRPNSLRSSNRGIIVAGDIPGFLGEKSRSVLPHPGSLYRKTG